MMTVPHRWRIFLSMHSLWGSLTQTTNQTNTSSERFWRLFNQDFTSCAKIFRKRWVSSTLESHLDSWDTALDWYCIFDISLMRKFPESPCSSSTALCSLFDTDIPTTRWWQTVCHEVSKIKLLKSSRRHEKSISHFSTCFFIDFLAKSVHGKRRREWLYKVI